MKTCDICGNLPEVSIQELDFGPPIGIRHFCNNNCLACYYLSNPNPLLRGLNPKMRWVSVVN